MSILLGLSAFYHDSAAALIIDGKVAAAAQEERFSRQKADATFPVEAIKSCLEQSRVSASEIDAVCFYEIPGLKFDRLIETFLQGAPRGFHAFRSAMPSWLSTKLQVRNQIQSRLLNPHNAEIRFCPHHLSHAASAFFPSPFESAAILTVDGVGEWATASIMRGQGNRVDPIVEQRFPNSLGLFYSAITTYCGFEVNSGEYKLMGLASYGVPRFTDLLMRDVINVQDDGAIKLSQKYFDYCLGLQMTSGAFHQLFGRPPRTTDQEVQELDRDLAASVQKITELAMVRMTRHACRLTGQRNLCLAGGVALNCVSIARLRELDIIDDLWVQPAAGDAGGAVGAALVIAHHKYNCPRIRDAVTADHELKHDSFDGAFLGPAFTRENIRQTIKDSGLEYEEFSDERILHSNVSRLLSQGHIIGWFQDRMEFGPRSLGHRSILADPSDPTMKDRVNRIIKHRDPFRPFAPAVLQRLAGEYFAVSTSANHDYMTEVCKVLQPDKLAAVTHVDGSARVQTVDPVRNPKFAALLEAYYEQTGIPVLLNTSFNDRDEPIVCSPTDAIACFAATNLDALVLDNFIILKQQRSPKLQPTTTTSQPINNPPAWLDLAFAIQLALVATLIYKRFGLAPTIVFTTAGTCALLVHLLSPSVREKTWGLIGVVAFPFRWILAQSALASVFFFMLTPLAISRRIAKRESASEQGWFNFTTTTDLGDESEVSRFWWIELLQFLQQEKKWWIIPIAISLILIAIAASVGGAVAPWIYALW